MCCRCFCIGVYIEYYFIVPFVHQVLLWRVPLRCGENLLENMLRLFPFHVMSSMLRLALLSPSQLTQTYKQ